MVSPLVFKRTDPNKTKNRNRGSGFYYMRSSYKRGWYSKYSGEGSQDGSYKFPAKAKDGRRGRSSPKLPRTYEHAGDRRRRKKTTHRVQVSPRKQKRKKGWF